MVKMQPVKISLGNVLKAKKLQQKKFEMNAAQEAAANEVKKMNEQFDTFVKETARDILNRSSKYELNVNNPDAVALSYTSGSENSIWAPWSKFANKK